MLASHAEADMIDWMDDRASIQSVSFSGHESFPLRFAWLTKAVRGVVEDAALFTRDDAVVRLGVGKNMVRAMRHWAARTDMIRPAPRDARGIHYKPTEIGDLLFGPKGLDPYLEDPATIWLVHWQLCSRSSPLDSRSGEIASPTTWYFLLNEFREISFTVESAVDNLLRYAERASGKRPSKGTIERDVSCFVRSYAASEPNAKFSREDTYDSPLAELGILAREAESTRLILDRSPRLTLSPHIFAYAVIDLWGRRSRNSETLSLQQVAYEAGGPGQVFRLPENACVELLESLDETTRGQISFDSTAGMRQLIRHAERLNPVSLLKQHFRTRKARVTSAA
jgi:hypothetical protein